jgi:hypothetical protein
MVGGIVEPADAQGTGTAGTDRPRCIFILASYAREGLQALWHRFRVTWRCHCPTARRRHLLRTVRPPSEFAEGLVVG